MKPPTFARSPRGGAKRQPKAGLHSRDALTLLYTLVLFSLVGLFSFPAHAGQPSKPAPREIDRLIRQLGSRSGKEQETAALALKGFGETALKSLREAGSSERDHEVSSRAKMLLRMLEPHAGQVWCNYAGPWGRDFSEVSYGVDCVAFSPDSRHVASAGEMGKVKLWNVATGALVRSFEADYSWVGRLAFSPDGRYLAAVDLFEDDGKPFHDQGSVIFVWEAATGKLVHRLKGTWLEWSVAFSKDGNQLVSAGKKVRWWDLKTGRVGKTFQRKGFFRFWGLSPDGRYVIGEKENKENLYAGSLIDLTTGTEMAHFPFGLEGETNPVSAAYSPDRKAVLFSGKMRLRDTRTGKDLVRFQGKPRANAVAISADGRRALSAHGKTLSIGPFELNWDCTVRLWDLETGKELQHYMGHQNPVSTVAFSPNGRYAASGSSHGTLRLWELPR